jgi:hypothetical protein
MRQTADQHSKAAWEFSRQAAKASDPAQKETLNRLAMQRRFVAKLAGKKEAEKMTKQAPVLVKELYREMEQFLDRLDNKFYRLLKQSPDLPAEIDEAANRLDQAGLLANRPKPTDNPRQAALMLIGDNPNLIEIWADVKEAGWWETAETPAELVSALRPNTESLD